MALKKRRAPTRSRTEQLYMLELLVDDLELRPDKIDETAGGDSVVRVGFVDLAPVDIGEPGKTCLFVREPSYLTRSLKSIPLSVEVYRIARSRRCRDSRDDDDDDAPALLCAATAFLPGCFCDRVRAAAAGRRGETPTSPCAARKMCALTDERGDTCGYVSILMRLSCFGGSIIDDMQLREKSFVFQGFPFGDDMPRSRAARTPDDGDGGTAKRDDDDVPREIPGRSERAKSHERGSALALTRPRSPPRVSMDQPGFERLTSAEKLNDPEYRGTIYATYPDEPTCACPPTGRTASPLARRSGCARACCDSSRSRHPGRGTFKADGEDAAGGSTDTAARDARSRGGGEEGGNVCASGGVTRCECDGDDPASRAFPFVETTTVLYRKQQPPSSSCQPRPRGLARTACACPGKRDLDSTRRTGATGCAKKPCTGPDCIIRAFEEAQDFVDSLGKVPGLMGLGLMDPTESPYFGREPDHPGREARCERRAPQAQPRLPPCTAPCNARRIPSGVQAATPRYDATLASATPGRAGVVREAIPTLPEATPVRPKRREDRKEERLEKQKEPDATAVAAPADVDVVGPCGEPQCKSRRKTAGLETTAAAAAACETVDEKKATARPKVSKGSVGRERPRRPRGKPGPGGDRDSAAAAAAAAVGRFPVRVSKRVMRYIYTIGDVYPGIHFGHKSCVDPRMRVPANMGWLWNVRDVDRRLKPRIGWKPGAIGRYLHELMREAKAASVEATVRGGRPRSVPSRTGAQQRRVAGRPYKTASYASLKKSLAKEREVEETELPPTLHIHRRRGDYYVTMYPIKDERATDVPRLEEPTKPLQFKIARNRDGDGASAASSSTASDMEIEFSPPAAVSRYRKRPDVVHVDTQVRQQEILDALAPPAGKKARDKKKKEKKEKRGRK